MPPKFAHGIGAEESVSGDREAWMRLLAKFLSDETGATAIEYCLIACGIAFAIIAVVQGIGPQLGTKFTAVNSSLK
jgi:pilus assembly protein Flp/PilA